jgi:ADP-ribose pyrophosphatase YjhB (NUDIX family)
MTLLELFEQGSERAYEICVPHISIDCVVFGFHASSLKVLLLKMKGTDKWGLPGGYMKKNENIEEAASRILKARTGASDIFLEQFKVFSKLGRSEEDFTHLPKHFWQRQRFISIGFYALVNYEEIIPKTDKISERCEWCDMDELPELMMDHHEIFSAALGALRKNLNYSPIGYNLLPKEFTMPQLQRLYELILGTPLHRGNFQRKIHGYDILTKQSKSEPSSRSPILYSFDVDKYNEALKNGLQQKW